MDEELNLPRTVVVVDDSPTVQRSVGAILARRGHTVIAAGDGLEALSKVLESDADLVLLDITLPFLSGYQICRLIKANAQTRHIPVVMLSGKQDVGCELRSRDAGAVEHVRKPFHRQELLRVIARRAQSGVATRPFEDVPRTGAHTGG